MQNAEIKHNLIIYNKNPVGFIKNEVATLDNIFKSDELGQWLEDADLTVKWEDGIFEKLALNRKFYEIELEVPLKNVRIWQLKPDFDVECRFVSYEEMTKKHGEIDLANYVSVFDGEIDTNDLEEIYTVFNLHPADDFVGHSLSMSDVIELYSENESNFHYVNRFGFKEIEFEKQEQNQGMEKGIEM